MKQDNFLFPNWNAPKNIHAAMSFRNGGTSCGVYESFNLALHVDDDEATVLKNRQQLRQTLQLPSEPCWLKQTHSSTVVAAEKNNPFPPNADASFTAQSGVVCSVLTADCLPILLCSKNGEKIAAIHAGWRGLLNGIVTNTIKAMDANDLIAWLGVAIGACCFEVGQEVRELFITKTPKHENAFQKTKQANKYLADIYRLAHTELALNGVDNISGGQYCSMCDSQKFYSYRRDKQTGRMATLIWKDSK